MIVTACALTACALIAGMNPWPELLAAHPYYSAASIFFLVAIIIIADAGKDIPFLLPVRWLLSGPFRPTPEFARLKSKYHIKRS